MSAITHLTMQRFTAFDEMDIELSPGINIFLGQNGTGKTHVLKALYSACDITRTKDNFARKLNSVFMPHGGQMNRLVHRQRGNSEAKITVMRSKVKLGLTFSNRTRLWEDAKITGSKEWNKTPLNCVYIPVKEMLANAPGFRSMYENREVHFEEVYADIVDRAYLPQLRGPVDSTRTRLLGLLHDVMEGRIVLKDEEFYHQSSQGHLEFPLLAEGIRKLGLLWLLIQNGTLSPGSILFWDEPESNLNPSIICKLVCILIELQQIGVQVFLATHDYVLLKEFDLQLTPDDSIAYHSLYREADRIKVHTSNEYLSIHPNAIMQAFSKLYDKDVQRAINMGRSND